MLTNLKKLLLSILCISMVITMIQPKIIMATEPEEVIVTEDDSIQNESVIKYEDLTLREESSKTYVMSDGSYQKVMYSIPVHVEEDEEWKEINNTLVEDEIATITDDSDEVVGYSTSKSKLKIKFSKKAHKNNLGSIQLDDYKIKWGIETDNKSEAKIIRNDETIEDERLKVFKNINQNIIYEDIYNHIDLEYAFDSNTIKENIILKDKTDINTFTFNYKVNNLVLILNNNQIEARDESSNELVFIMPQPYMVDDNGVTSYDVTYELVQENDKKYQIKVIADSEWLNDDQRAYPVAIDPVIITEQSRGSVDTTFITSNKATTNHTNKAEMIVGNESLEYGTCRTLVRIALPELKRGEMIVDAQLVLTSHARNFYSSSTPDLQINAHMITSDWTYNSVTWNTRPSYEDSTILDFELIRRSDDSQTNGIVQKNFNITNAVKQWYAGTKSNHGIVIKPNYETTSDYASYGVKGELWSERRTESTSAAYPFIALTYRNNKGIENYWDFISASTSDGDTIAVNTYSGNLVFIHEDVSTESSSLPVSISHIFNGYQADEQFASIKPNTGKGWKLNIQQKIRYSEKYGLTGEMLTKFPYVYIDEDGTEHFFKQTNDGLIDEDGLGLTLTFGNTDNDRFTITNKQGDKLIFHKNGNILKVQKKNKNEINYTYGTGDKDHHIIAVNSVNVNFTKCGRLKFTNSGRLHKN